MHSRQGQMLCMVAGIDAGSVEIKSWGSIRRRALLTDSVMVTSGAMFGTGLAAAAGLSTLKAADAAGSLQVHPPTPQ